MGKLDQMKMDLDTFASLMTEINEPLNWELVRETDGLFKASTDIMWIEWNEDGTFNSRHNEPAVGRSLLMSPFNQYFTWQTTEITSFQQSNDGNEVVFSTKNSNYILRKIYEPSV